VCTHEARSARELSAQGIFGPTLERGFTSEFSGALPMGAFKHTLFSERVEPLKFRRELTPSIACVGTQRLYLFAGLNVSTLHRKTRFVRKH
jgi:hypothetical protein